MKRGLFAARFPRHTLARQRRVPYFKAPRPHVYRRRSAEQIVKSDNPGHCPAESEDKRSVGTTRRGIHAEAATPTGRKKRERRKRTLLNARLASFGTRRACHFVPTQEWRAADKRGISNDADPVKSVFFFFTGKLEHTSAPAHELRLFLPLLFLRVTLTCSARLRSSTQCCPPNISSITFDQDELFELPVLSGRRVASSTGR